MRMRLGSGRVWRERELRAVRFVDRALTWLARRFGADMLPNPTAPLFHEPARKPAGNGIGVFAGCCALLRNHAYKVLDVN